MATFNDIFAVAENKARGGCKVAQFLRALPADVSTTVSRVMDSGRFSGYTLHKMLLEAEDIEYRLIPHRETFDRHMKQVCLCHR